MKVKKMNIVLLFLIGFMLGFVTIYLTYDNKEKTGVIFIQENNFDLLEQNSK